MSRSLPTLVLIPGSWHRPTCYEKIVKILHGRYKLECVLVELPSTMGNPSAGFKEDLDAARDAVSGEVGKGNDVVIISHSYGGMVGNSVVKDFVEHAAGNNNENRTVDREQGTKMSQPDSPSTRFPAGHVIGIVLIASGFTLTGLSFMDPFLGRPPPAWRVNRETGNADLAVSPEQLFYHDLPKHEAVYYSSQLTTQSLKALFEGGEYAYAGWMDVPVWYLGTTEDRGLPVFVQRMQVGMARQMGGKIEHRELCTSHSPFLSQPESTAELLVQAVSAFSGCSLMCGPTVGQQKGMIKVPAARFWQPLTWFQFGCPLAIGHCLGRAILAFQGIRRRLWHAQ